MPLTMHPTGGLPLWLLARLKFKNPAAPAVKREEGLGAGAMAVKPDAIENFGNALSRHTAFADASAARAGGPHFGARSGRSGVRSQEGGDELLGKMLGAQFEISVDGKRAEAAPR